MVSIWEGDQSYPMRLAEKTAVRLNKKTANKYPLFEAAGILEKQTPEEIEARYSKHNNDYAQKMIAMWNSNAKEAAERVRQVAAIIPEEKLKELEAYRVRTFPHEAEYDLSFWKKHLPEGGNSNVANFGNLNTHNTTNGN